MTGTEWKAYVLKKFKRTDKDTELYQATTDTIADMRLQFDSEDYKEEAYVAGIAALGDYKFALPSDFGNIIGAITVIDTASNQDYDTLVKVSKEEYDERTPDRLLTSGQNYGVPTYYCIYGKEVFIGPVPDKTTYRFQMNYTTEAFTEVSASTTSVPFSDRYRNILRCGVLAELHDGLENFEESQYWRAMYTSGLSKIKQNDDDNIADDNNVAYNGI